MGVILRAEPIDRDIELMLNDNLSPAAQSRAFAQYAGEQIDEVKQTNRAILGRDPRYTLSVDGRGGASLDAVKPDGVAVAEFELVNDVLDWILDQLATHSPTKSGRYKRSHALFADGREVEAGGDIPPANEYVFINTQPYANKIERGASSQAPDGVYQAVAFLAQRRFGNIAKITFDFRAPFGGALIGGRVGNKSENRQPAIIVRLPR